jgi:hypothetical protein
MPTELCASGMISVGWHREPGRTSTESTVTLLICISSNVNRMELQMKCLSGDNTNRPRQRG